MATETRKGSYHILRLTEPEDPEPGSPDRTPTSKNVSLWEKVAVMEAKSPLAALQAHTKKDGTPGTYVAVTAGSWFQKTLKAREGFDLI